MRRAVQIALLSVATGCNALSGVDELAFDLGDPPSDGGHGGAPVTSAGGADFGGFGGTGGFGGGAECGLCDTPPGPCHEMIGTCDAGSCVYALLAQGASCSDGDPCTEGDACDAGGKCIPGPECPNSDPCLDVTCEAMGCVETLKNDGASCGPLPADRCCNGACVDVSSDANNCGGCGYSCGGGEVCESVAATNQCASTPADTTGRCTCDANARCPAGQICRNQSPHAFRCTPEGQADCPGTTFIDQSFCPNFCTY